MPTCLGPDSLSTHSQTRTPAMSPDTQSGLGSPPTPSLQHDTISDVSKLHCTIALLPLAVPIPHFSDFNPLCVAYSYNGGGTTAATQPAVVRRPNFLNLDRHGVLAPRRLLTFCTQGLLGMYEAYGKTYWGYIV